MFNHLFSISNKNYQLYSPFILRLIIGAGFIVHGWAKLSKGTPAGFEKLLTQLQVPFPHVTAWVASLTEVFGGLGILAGLSVGVVAIPLIFTMLVALFTVNINYGFSSIKTIGLTPQGPLFGPPGYEINLLYIAGLISLILTGAGIFSVDALLAKRRGLSK
ncbi:DoxX family protein [Mucilaginibacter limnophilus]|uniref:DoxX family protein n=1 Tax=Mucilaginibacter limnophilus TaxID=1932778 RepID=A0A3S2VL10_9SPHI|nr:DoxX family protein [Mucilaginibacter limnophilus]RVT98490.1 DoxX family protein [Mucilaginibacter limnophilus]